MLFGCCGLLWRLWLALGLIIIAVLCAPIWLDCMHILMPLNFVCHCCDSVMFLLGVWVLLFYVRNTLGVWVCLISLFFGFALTALWFAYWVLLATCLVLGF